MRNDPDKGFVASFFINMGLSVETIPETANKTPDLRVLMPDGKILVEVKSKEDDRQLRDLLESPPGTSRPFYASSVASSLHDAWRQIRDFQGRRNDDFTLIWFITRKLGDITVLTRGDIKTYIYGIETITGQKIDRTAFNSMPCYFFNESFFFKYKELDGIVVHEDLLEGQLVELCLNPYSPHYNTFKRIQLARFFRDHSLVIDPLEMDAAGKSFFVDCVIPRKDKDAIVGYLKNKYALDSVTFEKFQIINWPVN